MSEESFDREHWVEAEQWLAHHYHDEARWKVFSTGPSIFIHKYDYHLEDIQVAHVFQDKFRELVAEKGFDAAMEHVLVTNGLIIIVRLNHKDE